MPFSEIRQNLSVDKYVLAYQAERKEEELKRFVLASHVSFEDWRKKQKHLSLAEDVTNKSHGKVDGHTDTKSDSKSMSKKSSEKEKSKQPIPFPSECTIPINPVLVESVF